MPYYEGKERATGFSLKVVIENICNSSFSGTVGKEVKFHRVMERVSTEETEEAGGYHSFKKSG